jgi:hypothetical protein
MTLERALLISFLGNYLINNVAAPLAAFVPSDSGAITPQYIAFIAFAGVIVAAVTWWYLVSAKTDIIVSSGLFGIVGFAVSIATSLITGISGVLVQTASISTLLNVLTNFLDFVWNWSTLVLLGY